jgi:hypothetical protein
MDIKIKVIKLGDKVRDEATGDQGKVRLGDAVPGAFGPVGRPAK